MLGFYDALAKNLTAADVHQGSSKPPGKPRGPLSFADALEMSEAERDAAMQKRALVPKADSPAAYTPFPFDVGAFASLRPDQAPRFLGALTDPGAQATRTVRLDSLYAMQDRVDPEKVRAIASAGVVRGKPALVVRFNGRDYIADGHHRLAGEWLAGKDEALVHYRDLEPRDEALKSFKANVVVAKAAPEQQMIFGWASVCEIDGQTVVDKQDDAIEEVELEKGAYDFVLNARNHGHMHGDESVGGSIGTGRMVESMMFTREKQQALGIDLKKVGWWVGFKVDDPKVWDSHKRGELPEFSIGGSGRRVSV